MKTLLITLALLLFISACSTTKTTKTTIGNDPTTTEQIFIGDAASNIPPKGLPGKCYSKMKLEQSFKWAEIICQNQINSSLIQQIQMNLLGLGYLIDNTEIDKKQLGQSTKAAIKAFQLKNNMAFGGLDWATVNRIAQQ